MSKLKDFLVGRAKRYEEEGEAQLIVESVRSVILALLRLAILFDVVVGLALTSVIVVIVMHRRYRKLAKSDPNYRAITVYASIEAMAREHALVYYGYPGILIIVHPEKQRELGMFDFCRKGREHDDE